MGLRYSHRLIVSIEHQDREITVQNLSQPPSTNTIAIKHQFQLGAINRATRQLISAHTHTDVIQIMIQLCENLGLSGFVYMSGFNFRKAKKIGSGLPRNKIRSVMELLQQLQKIALCGSMLCFKYDDITLVVHNTNHDSAQDDLLQDDMAIFIDSLDIWLKKHNSRLETEALIQQQLSEFRRTLLYDQKLMNSHRDVIINQLLTDMATILPMLGLEQDQEEEIYNAIEPIVCSMSQSQEDQASSNQDFLQIVSNLLTHLQSKQDPAPTEEECITLF